MVLAKMEYVNITCKYIAGMYANDVLLMGKMIEIELKEMLII